MMNRREMIYMIQDIKINKTFLEIRTLNKISTSISETGMIHKLHYVCWFSMRILGHPPLCASQSLSQT